MNNNENQLNNYSEILEEVEDVDVSEPDHPHDDYYQLDDPNLIYASRLQSMVGWEHPVLVPAIVALFGFYFNRPTNTMVCSVCKCHSQNLTPTFTLAELLDDHDSWTHGCATVHRVRHMRMWDSIWLTFAGMSRRGL